MKHQPMGLSPKRAILGDYYINNLIYVCPYEAFILSAFRVSVDKKPQVTWAGLESTTSSLLVQT